MYIDEKRMDLKGYDPFPSDVGKKRTLGDYTFSIKVMATYTGGQASVYVVKDSKTGIEKEWSSFYYGKIRHTDSPLAFFENSLSQRKMYSVRGTLYAWYKDRARHQYDYVNKTMGTMMTKHPRLAEVLKADHKDWLRQRKIHNKKLGGKLSPVKDLIYTEEAIVAHGAISKLQSAVNLLVSKGDRVTEEDVKNVHKNMRACQGRTGPLGVIAKHARSRK